MSGRHEGVDRQTYDTWRSKWALVFESSANVAYVWIREWLGFIELADPVQA